MDKLYVIIYPRMAEGGVIDILSLELEKCVTNLWIVKQLLCCQFGISISDMTLPHI